MLLSGICALSPITVPSLEHFKGLKEAAAQPELQRDLSGCSGDYPLAQDVLDEGGTAHTDPGQGLEHCSHLLLGQGTAHSPQITLWSFFSSLKTFWKKGDASQR